MIPSSDRGSSTGQGERLECLHCHKYHSGTCRLITSGCFQCGRTYHLIVNCPHGSRISRNPQRSSKGGSNIPPPTCYKGRGRGSLGQHRRSIASETVNRPTTKSRARAYAMKAREDRDAPGVTAGNFTLYNSEMHALINLNNNFLLLKINFRQTSFFFSFFTTKLSY